MNAPLTKDQAEAQARGLGWKGDPARTSKQELLDYINSRAPDFFPAPAPTVSPTVATVNPADAIAQAIAAIAAQVAPKPAEAAPLDPEAVRAIVRQELEGIAPRKLEVTSAAGSVTLAEHLHPQFEKVLRLVSAGLNVLLVGPAGTGKTHLAHQVAKALQLNYGAIHCTAGVTESQLFGWLLPSGEGGRFEYRPAPFVSLFEQGNSLFLFDELDAADPNLLLAANSALANGHIHVPQRLDNPAVKKGENARIMATANTFGNGADYVYAGRNQLDAATLDRFYVIHVDYDRRLESSISLATIGDEDKSASLLSWVWETRERAAAAKLRRVISTRAVQKGAAALAAGFPFGEVKADLLAGWSRDEMNKVGAL